MEDDGRWLIVERKPHVSTGAVITTPRSHPGSSFRRLLQRSRGSLSLLNPLLPQAF